jgi:hypothetical protein
MTPGKQQVKSEAAAKDPYHAYRRRVQKDTLLADNPPPALGIGLVVIAVVLAAAVYALHWVEYQETVSVVLTLKTGDAAGAAYGETYMRPGEVTKVQAGQAVRLDWGRKPAAEGADAEATVGEVRAVGDGELYAVRVDLPPGQAEGPGVGPAPSPGARVQAKIITQKQNLLDKLFGFFRMIAQSI